MIRSLGNSFRNSIQNIFSAGRPQVSQPGRSDLNQQVSDFDQFAQERTRQDQRTRQQFNQIEETLEEEEEERDSVQQSSSTNSRSMASSHRSYTLEEQYEGLSEKQKAMAFQHRTDEWNRMSERKTEVDAAGNILKIVVGIYGVAIDTTPSDTTSRNNLEQNLLRTSARVIMDPAKKQFWSPAFQELGNQILRLKKLELDLPIEKTLFSEAGDLCRKAVLGKKSATTLERAFQELKRAERYLLVVLNEMLEIIDKGLQLERYWDVQSLENTKDAAKQSVRETQQKIRSAQMTNFCDLYEQEQFTSDEDIPRQTQVKTPAVSQPTTPRQPREDPYRDCRAPSDLPETNPFRQQNHSEQPSAPQPPPPSYPPQQPPQYQEPCPPHQQAHPSYPPHPQQWPPHLKQRD